MAVSVIESSPAREAEPEDRRDQMRAPPRAPRGTDMHMGTERSAAMPILVMLLAAARRLVW